MCGPTSEVQSRFSHSLPRGLRSFWKALLGKASAAPIPATDRQLPRQFRLGEIQAVGTMSSTVSAVVRFGTCDWGLSIASLFFSAGVQGLGFRVLGVTSPKTVRSMPRARPLLSGIQSSECGVRGREEGACLRRVDPPASANLRGAPPSLPAAAIPRAALPSPLIGTFGADGPPSSDRQGGFCSTNLLYASPGGGNHVER